MLLKEEEKNLYTAAVGTAIFHLLILIAFLGVRLGDVKIAPKAQVVIEFDDKTYKAIQEYAKHLKPLESYGTKAPVVKGTDNGLKESQEVLKNIAVNTTEKIKDKISTEKYIEQVKQELGIKELNQQLDRSAGEEPVAEDSKKNTNNNSPAEKKTYHGPTRITYSLEGRTERYMHVPVYKCESSGTISLDIVVSPSGAVINASVASASTDDDCLAEAALDAARKSSFNIKLDAESKEHGTINYEFVAQ